MSLFGQMFHIRNPFLLVINVSMCRSTSLVVTNEDWDSNMLIFCQLFNYFIPVYFPGPSYARCRQSWMR